MRIIIEVKDTATLDRIDKLDKALHSSPIMEFSDVIKSISKEWN